MWCWMCGVPQPPPQDCVINKKPQLLSPPPRQAALPSPAAATTTFDEAFSGITEDLSHDQQQRLLPRRTNDELFIPCRICKGDTPIDQICYLPECSNGLHYRCGLRPADHRINNRQRFYCSLTCLRIHEQKNFAVPNTST